MLLICAFFPCIVRLVSTWMENQKGTDMTVMQNYLNRYEKRQEAMRARIKELLLEEPVRTVWIGDVCLTLDNGQLVALQEADGTWRDPSMSAAG